MTDELWRKWAAARVWAAHQVPYLAHALLALVPVVAVDPAAGLRRFPADLGWHIHLNPAEVERRSVPEIGFWLVHQVTHLLREHARRYPGTERQHWNLATDAEINDDLGLALPTDAVTPTLLGLPNGWTAEQYWQVLKEPPVEAGRRDLNEPAVEESQHDPNEPAVQAARHGPNEPPRASNGHNPNKPPRASDGHDPNEPAAGENRHDLNGPVAEEGGKDRAGPAAEGDCGSGCDGLPRAWDCREGLSGTGARLVVLDTARRIRERQRARDDVPAGWLRWAEQALEPAVNWRRLLAATVRRGLAQVAGRVDYTYRRPSRRAAALPEVVLPSLRRPSPKVTVLVDTSGSVSDGLLGQALAEVTGVLRAVGAGRRLLTVVSCDARAYRGQRVGRVSELRLGGGGGTDLRAGFAAAPRSDLIIAITDGRTPWPVRPPAGTRVIVGLLGPGGEAPEWAETVHIPKSGAS
ncbi:VWA-like domain [Nonomuraea solani]|uniref:VWA-like domain n=1 Tax=Nonomuraea solani TaxID=1144553 RepID=A0A1H6EXC7_9ACTN|nr:VWA-like domain-containing protein [Nonomuraea solani]SEH01595.1 VWA-like domain [Nonomuraea solani]